MELTPVTGRLLDKAFARAGSRWFVDAAREALRSGHYSLIPGRRGEDLYLARFWLTPPARLGDDGSWESADSVLLHYFAKPDDDGSLHDHPWSFKTTVLAGGYDEFLPPEWWLRRHAAVVVDDHQAGRHGALATPIDGPDYGERVNSVNTGESASHAAADLHAVGRVDRGTWTMVRTGPRERDWGFHPPGQPWTPWRAFLDEARGAAGKAMA